jgi:hypothetical protein
MQVTVQRARRASRPIWVEAGGGGYFIIELVEFLESHRLYGTDLLPVGPKAFPAFDAVLLRSAILAACESDQIMGLVLWLDRNSNCRRWLDVLQFAGGRLKFLRIS